MPQNWKTYKLEELVTKLGDGLHGTPKFSDDGEYFFINGNNLSNGKIQIKSDTKRVDTDQYIKYKKELTDRTILVSINGTIGSVGTYNNEKVVLGKSACYFNVKEEIDKDFLKHVISSKYFLDYIESNYTGSVIKNVSLKSMREFPITLPLLPEQNAIASILSALDDKIELNLQQNKTLEEMAMALYKHWFVDFGPFKEGKFIDSELGRIPEGWEVKKLGNIIEVVNGFAFKGVDFCEEGVSVLKIKNVKPGKILFENMAFVTEDKTIKAQRAKIAFRDILITMTGNRMAGGMESWVGKVAMFPRTGDYYLNQRVSKIHLNSNNEFLRDYLSIMLSSEEFQYYFIKNSTSSGGQANISPDLIKEIKLIHPPIDVLLNFQTIVKLYFDKRALIDLENQTLINQRDSLLPKLISGEVRVKNIEPQINAIA
jgi:type I restriction enzyme S subunit